jgi:hypothetical protein
MKHVTKMLIVLLLGAFVIQNAAAQANYEIEFRVNMGVQLLSGDFDPASGDIVSVSGSMNGWDTTADTLAADFIDPNIYSGIIKVENSSDTQFAFKFTTRDADGNVGWEGGSDKILAITGSETDADANGFIDLYYPAQGVDAPFFSGITFDDVFTEDTNVIVAVDARPAYYHIADSSGMPVDTQTGDPVTSFTGLFANGPFANSVNGWESWGDNLAGRSDLQLLDDGSGDDAVAGDSIFTLTLLKKAGQAKRSVDLKFGVNGFDNESTFAGNHTPSIDEANPTLNLAFGAMLQSDGSYVDGLFDPYIIVDNSATPPTFEVVRRGGENDIIPVDVEVEFRVNMGVSLLNGSFDPAGGDIVSVSGSMNGWDTTADTLAADFIDPNVYSGIVRIENHNGGDQIAFKFTTRDSDGNVGWEGGSDKTLLITGQESDADGNGYLDAYYPAEGEDAPFFSGISFDDVFTTETNVVITVDARPAYYHIADSSGMPVDTQTGDPVTSFDGLFANGPFANSVNGWESWGDNLAGRADLKLVDDGTNGDAVAGDSVYTITITKGAGEPKRGVELKFGVNGFDNESTFAGNHQPDVDEANPTLNLVFGAMLQSDGTFVDRLFDPYILVDNSATPPTAMAVRRGGEDDTEMATNTDDLFELPEQITLHQNYPNPFNPVTTIAYELKQSSRVSLTVYDLLGRQIATLVDGIMPAAAHTVQFDASQLASGMYMYRLQAGDQVLVKTMMLLK